jgi:hypothetical protein
MIENTPLIIKKYNPYKITIYVGFLILSLSLILNLINFIYIIKFNYIIEQIIPYKNKLITLIDIACSDLNCINYNITNYL